MNITNFALTKVALEWDNLCRTAHSNPPKMGACDCAMLLQFGLPCQHHLYPFYLSRQPIPRSLCHPRWWLEGGPITTVNWAPFTDSLPFFKATPQPLFMSTERRILELREEMDSENRHRFDM